MGLTKYLFRRVIEGAITLFIVITIIFLLFRIMPGDPLSTVMDPKMTPEVKAAIRHSYGLDESILVQYGLYIKNMLTLDLGDSWHYSRPVTEVLARRIPSTLLLFTPATVLSAVLGIMFGRIIAWRRNSKLEYSLTLVGLFFYMMPIFFFGLILIYIFAFKLGLFPTSGMIDYELWTFGATASEKIIDILHHLILPLITLTMASFCGMMLLMRTSMVETLREDYVEAARARGLPDKVVRNRYAARNAELPVVTALILGISLSMGGGVITETIFSWPGVGWELFTATVGRDYPLAQGCFFILALITIVAVIAIDIAYAYLDPRISYD
jgi:ABC-type dipeptide/oligopeptide/nickel transport systems, permease components